MRRPADQAGASGFAACRQGLAALAAIADLAGVVPAGAPAWVARGMSPMTTGRPSRYP